MIGFGLFALLAGLAGLELLNHYLVYNYFMNKTVSIIITLGLLVALFIIFLEIQLRQIMM